MSDEAERKRDVKNKKYKGGWRERAELSRDEASQCFLDSFRRQYFIGDQSAQGKVARQ